MNLPETFQWLILFPVISFVENSKQRDGKSTVVFGEEILYHSGAERSKWK